MKIIVSLIFANLLFIYCSPAYAIIYEWYDKNGSRHITDSMEKIPDDYRAGAKVIKADTPKSTVQPPSTMQAPPGPGTGNQMQTPPVPAETMTNELYGDYQLGWWQQKIEQARADVERKENHISTKEQYIRLYENGLRTGQYFEKKDSEKYEKYLKDLPEDRTKLKELKDDLEEILRKARIAGVPKKVRGEE